MTTKFTTTELLYDNPLASEADMKGFVHEGNIDVTFPNGRMQLKNKFERSEHECGNFVYWCPKDFPDHIAASWDFRPLADHGLAMFWIAAKGRQGEDVLDPALAPRHGVYRQYFQGDINALHVSYYRRNSTEIGFRTCNLRKSYGFHLVAQGGDPLPDFKYATQPYRVQVIKAGPYFRFSINNVMLFDWTDPGDEFGPVLSDGKIGFRQMAGLIGEYANLQVHRVSSDA